MYDATYRYVRPYRDVGAHEGGGRGAYTKSVDATNRYAELE
jgi:hypothetical protein